jgi:preprotein translocase subunit SecG
MVQTVLFVIFVVEFALALVVLLSWKSDYGLSSSFEERHPPPPTPPR